MTPGDITAFRTAARLLVELGAARLRDLDPSAVPPGYTSCWAGLTAPDGQPGPVCTDLSCRRHAPASVPAAALPGVVASVRAMHRAVLTAAAAGKDQPGAIGTGLPSQHEGT
jgi:hypothetical protein